MRFVWKISIFAAILLFIFCTSVGKDVVMVQFTARQNASIKFTSPQSSPTLGEGADPAHKINFYRVVATVDGDTIKIVRDGATTTVRLVGVDTPETVDPHKPVQCFGKESSEETKRIIAESDYEVRIVTDITQSKYDKYGRLLAYVYLQDGTMLDEYLVANGYGREYTFKNSTYQFQKEFRQAQANARALQLGLWSLQTCGGGL